MATIHVNNVTLTYELLGAGSPVVLTPTGFNGMDYLRPLAEALAVDHQVLLYDRRNCGTSELAITDAPSEFHLWADDLHALLQALELAPAHVLGASGGSVLSLLLAHQQPEDVRTLLLLMPPVDDPELCRGVCHNRYGLAAEQAEIAGMEAVAEFADWRDHLERNPDRRAQLLTHNPQMFAKIVRRWEEFVTGERFSFAGLSDAELRSIRIPTLITPGLDALHPRPVCRRLHERLPHATLMLPEERFPSEELAQFKRWYEEDRGHIRYLPALAPMLRDFMAATGLGC